MTLQAHHQKPVIEHIPVLSVATASLCANDVARIPHAAARAAVQDALRSLEQSPGMSFSYVHYSYTMRVLVATQRTRDRYQPTPETLNV